MDTYKPITSMKNAFSVEGLNVVITGGNGGIGFGIASAFAQSGANVAILARNMEKCRHSVEELSQYGTKIFSVPCDTTDLSSVRSSCEKVYQEFDHIDVLVNNAGVSANVSILEDEELSTWHRVLDTNLNGVVNMIHVFAPKMIEAMKGGLILNISSIAAFNVANAREMPMAGYFVSKAAVNQLTKYLAVELGQYRIRVNALAPGMIHSGLDGNLPPQMLDMIHNKMPMGRFGEPLECGAMSVYLASQAGCHVTGDIIVLDGGFLTIK